MDEPAIGPKPCPKCGALPRILETIFTFTPFVICPTCGLETKACKDPEQAVALWNAEQYESPGRDYPPSA